MTRPTYADFLIAAGVEPEGLYPCVCSRQQIADELYDVRAYDDDVIDGHFRCWTCISHQDRIEQAEAAEATTPAPSWSAECQLGNQRRAERQQLLAVCDWTQTMDAPLSPDRRQEWADYRQALRDITETVASPDLVVWPITPV